ncbi:MAG: DUF1295 domain-containing protein [Saprospiraceae bacterium]
MDRAKIIRLFILVLIISLGTFLWGFSEFQETFQSGIGVLMAIMVGLWIISLVIKDASIIDIFWGFGFVIIAWFYAFQNDLGSLGIREQILLGMITIWGLRLTIYLAIRNLGKGEDYRYAQWRKDNGEKWWWLSFIRVFALQGFLLWIISATYLPSFSITAEMGVLEYVGVLLWAIGLFFEAVGDYQLSQFKKDPNNKGKVLDTGVWRYTRHPNYFGDATIWWGFFLFALAHPHGWMFVFCPIVMTFFLLKVSGVAMLEVKLKKTKPQYAEYIRTTSSFIPMPPKK